MRKIFIIFAALFLLTPAVYAENIEKNFETYSAYNILNKEKSDKAKIKELFSNLNKYSNTQDADKIK